MSGVESGGGGWNVHGVVGKDEKPAVGQGCPTSNYIVFSIGNVAVPVVRMEMGGIAVIAKEKNRNETNSGGRGIEGIVKF